MSEVETSTSSQVNCSFCGKSQREVACMVMGPRVGICDECVRLCIDIIFKKLGDYITRAEK